LLRIRSRHDVKFETMTFVVWFIDDDDALFCVDCFNAFSSAASAASASGIKLSRRARFLASAVSDVGRRLVAAVGSAYRSPIMPQAGMILVGEVVPIRSVLVVLEPYFTGEGKEYV
jgi:hypothetical protein